MNTKLIQDRKQLIKDLNKKQTIISKEIESIEKEIIDELKEDFVKYMLPRFEVSLEDLNVENFKDDCHDLFNEYMYHYSIDLADDVSIRGDDGYISFMGERSKIIAFLQRHGVKMHVKYIHEKIKHHQEKIDEYKQILEEAND